MDLDKEDAKRWRAFLGMVRDGTVFSISVSMNDVFAPAADGFEIEEGEDLLALVDTYNKKGWQGIVDAESKRRGVKPQSFR